VVAPDPFKDSGSGFIGMVDLGQAAQLDLLKDPRYDHSCYWAPFLLINNWL
jgi:hypothetical protein